MLSMFRRLLGKSPPVRPDEQTHNASGGSAPSSSSEDTPKELDLDEMVKAVLRADDGNVFETVMDQFATFALARRELPGGTVDDVLGAMISAIDERLCAQLNEILHHPGFQALEGAWRGLEYLIANVEWDAKLKLRVMNFSRDELQSTLKTASRGASPHGPLSNALFEEVYRTSEGEPYGVMVLDQGIANSAEDAELLTNLGRICARAQTVLLAGLSPALYTSRDIAGAQGASGEGDRPELDHPAWTELRQNLTSRYIGMCLPRILGRSPYRGNADPGEGFVFNEDVSPGTASGFLWINSAYAMAANIGRSARTYGWAVRIRGVEGGGEVDGLPEVVVPSAGGSSEVMPPVEIVLDERREAELAKAGLIPLLHRKRTARAVFFSAQSLNLPRAGEVLDPEQKARDAVLRRLPYTLCASRYAHCIMRMAADWREPLGETFERHVQAWLGRSVHPRPWELNPEQRALFPLQEARFTLTGEGSGQAAVLEVIPGFQFEGLGVSIRLQLTLPA